MKGYRLEDGGLKHSGLRVGGWVEGFWVSVAQVEKKENFGGSAQHT